MRNRRIGIVPHLARRSAAVLAEKTALDLESRGATVVVPQSDAVVVGLERWAIPDAEFANGLDIAFSLGGDGTMLRTVDLVLEHDVPVLGVNVGHLGYLTALLPDQLPEKLDRLLSSDYDTETRMTLAVEVIRPDGSRTSFSALNDAVVEKSSPGNTVRLGVSFNGRPFLDYSTDGLIAATPTGSTAYAFSVRGPIVSPTMTAIIVVPVSPHMLFDRSLVLDGSETVTISVLDGRAGALFVDGRECGAAPEGTVIHCSKGIHTAQLVNFGDRDFYGRVTTKFELPLPGESRTRERFTHLGFDGTERRGQ